VSDLYWELGAMCVCMVGVYENGSFTSLCCLSRDIQRRDIKEPHSDTH